MKLLRIALKALLVAGFAVVMVEPALAIPPGNRFGPNATAAPITRPVVSPYVALGPGGLNRAMTTYFTFIRPQIAQSQAIQRQQTSISQLQHEVRLGTSPIYGQTGYGQSGTQSVRSTGYQTWFMQHQRHFGGGQFGGGQRATR